MIGGFLTFLFHSQLTLLGCVSNNTKQYLSLYVLAVGTILAILIDSSVFGVKIEGIKVLGLCLILLPSVAVDSLFFRKN